MLFPGDDAGWLDFFGKLYIWFTLLAVFCTAIALFASGGIKRYSERIGKTQALKIAEAREHSSNADERAGKANEEAGKANERAAKLEVRASEAEARATKSEAEVAKANAASKEAVARVAEAEARSVEASTKAESFRLDIAKANESAEESRHIAESERLARVKIEERIGGWKLPLEARDRLIERLKPFTKTPFSLYVNPDETSFMNVMDAALLAAGWERREPKGPANEPFTILLSSKAAILYISGITIEVAAEKWDAFGPAVTALIQGLISEGIPARGIAPKGANPESVHVIIGKRE